MARIAQAPAALAVRSCCNGYECLIGFHPTWPASNSSNDASRRDTSPVTNQPCDLAAPAHLLAGWAAAHPAGSRLTKQKLCFLDQAILRPCLVGMVSRKKAMCKRLFGFWSLPRYP